jgi:hypothetical protein
VKGYVEWIVREQVLGEFDSYLPLAGVQVAADQGCARI